MPAVLVYSPPAVLVTCSFPAGRVQLDGGCEDRNWAIFGIRQSQLLRQTWSGNNYLRKSVDQLFLAQ